jgi:hypothetical protein
MQRLHTTLALGLTALLLLCPLLCGPGEVRCDHSCQQEDEPEPCNAPDPCNEGGDNCICHGATLASVVSGAPKVTLNHPSFTALVSTAAHGSAPAERFGPSSLRAPSTAPDGTAVRILLQSFLS